MEFFQTLGNFFLTHSFLGRIWEFGQFFYEFWIIIEQSIFIVEKRLPYEKSSMFDEEYDDEKKVICLSIKQYASVFSVDRLKTFGGNFALEFS